MIAGLTPGCVRGGRDREGRGGRRPRGHDAILSRTRCPKTVCERGEREWFRVPPVPGPVPAARRNGWPDRASRAAGPDRRAIGVIGASSGEGRGPPPPRSKFRGRTKSPRPGGAAARPHLGRRFLSIGIAAAEKKDQRNNAPLGALARQHFPGAPLQALNNFLFGLPEPARTGEKQKTQHTVEQEEVYRPRHAVQPAPDAGRGRTQVGVGVGDLTCLSQVAPLISSACTSCHFVLARLPARWPFPVGLPCPAKFLPPRSRPSLAKPGDAAAAATRLLQHPGTSWTAAPRVPRAVAGLQQQARCGKAFPRGAPRPLRSLQEG